MDKIENKMLGNQEFANADEYDLKEIWRIIHSYRGSIAIIFSVIVVFTIYLTLTTRPVWQATTVVMMEESGSNPSSFVFDFGMNKS